MAETYRAEVVGLRERVKQQKATIDRMKQQFRDLSNGGGQYGVQLRACNKRIENQRAEINRLKNARGAT